MSENITSRSRRPSLGRSVGLVPFLFGLAQRESLPGLVLRRLLEDLGLTDVASRALLARMLRHGQLSSSRRGREVDYRLAGDFAASFARVRDHSTSRPPRWNGYFYAVLYQVPESQRAFRDTLRRTAVLVGYGILQPGVLIAPNDRSNGLVELLEHPPAQAHVWLSRLAMDTRAAARAASYAWDLAALADTYLTHVERLDRATSAHRAVLAGTTYADESSTVRNYVDAVLPAVMETVREPGLPIEILPPRWPRPRLQAAIEECTMTFAGTTDPYVHRLLQ